MDLKRGIDKAVLQAVTADLKNNHINRERHWKNYRIQSHNNDEEIGIYQDAMKRVPKMESSPSKRQKVPIIYVEEVIGTVLIEVICRHILSQTQIVDCQEYDNLILITDKKISMQGR